MIKIDIISGFLGAGKTTLIKKLFQNGFNGEKVVLIENEFGDISIDSGFLKDSGVKIKEINAGCICCSLVGDFETAIKDLVNQFHPDRIIIEPSGVGKLSDIINAVEKVKLNDLCLNILATVVDGKKAKMYLKNFGEFFLNQIEAANTVIISKTEILSEEQIDELINIIKEHNEHANIITTNISLLSSDTLLKTLESHRGTEEIIKQAEHEHHHNHDHDEHECCCHHHDEDEHECCHHHDEELDDDDCCCHHHDEDEHECCHHHDEELDDDDCCCHHHDEDEHECCHHHDEELDDDDCCCHHHDEDDHDCCCHHHDEEGHHHHHHDADEVFTSWGIETAKSVSKEELSNFLDSLYDESLGLIVRCKGILKAKDNEKWYYFDYVSGEVEIRLGEPDYTGRIVVIGSKINKEKISSMFKNI